MKGKDWLLPMALRDDFLHRTRILNSGKARIQALELEGEPTVVNAHQVQHCGMQIMQMNLAVYRAEAEFVRLPVRKSSLYSPAPIAHVH